MPLNLIFITPGDYLIEDDGIPGNNTSVIRDGSGTVIFTFIHPADALGFTTSSPGINITVNLTESLGAATFTIGSLTDPALSPDNIVMNKVTTTGAVTLVANQSITEFGVDAAPDIVGGSLILSAQTGVGTAANAIETQVGALEAETATGGIALANTGSVQIGGLSDQVDGLDVVTAGDLTFSSLGTILLGDETGAETVHGGSTSGNVTLTALGFDADIIAITDQDAINAPGGNIALTAGRDIAFGIIGANFDNDVRARDAVIANAGRDFLVDGFSDIASDDFGAGTGGNAVITAGRNVHVRNVAGTDGSITASGSSGADVIITAGPGGAVVLDAPTTAAVTSFNGDVFVNADRLLIAAQSGITAGIGTVVLDTATVGRGIVLGSAGDSGFSAEISDAEIDRIFAKTLVIGSDDTGQVEVIAPLSFTQNDVTLRSGAGIAFANAVSLTATGLLTIRSGDDFTVPTSSSLSAQELKVFVDQIAGDLATGGLAFLHDGVVAKFGTITGNADADILHGTLAPDVMSGLGGNDFLRGGAGGDTINGGGGTDTASFLGGNGVTVSLLLGTAQFGHAQGDTLIGIENLNGSAFFDELTGDAGANVLRGDGGNDFLNGSNGADDLFGDAGDDTLVGGAGADDLDGGADTDTASYANSDLAVQVDLATGVGAGGHAAGDTLVSIETVIGSAFADTLVGGGGAETLNGGQANDLLFGSFGNDRLNGNQGSDTVDYSTSSAAVSVSLLTGVGSGGHAAGDLLTGVENLTGSDFADLLTGSTGVNALVGGEGGDSFNGSLGNDQIFGQGGDDLIVGGAGADAMNGGNGTDTVFYSTSAAVTVNLNANTGAGGDAAGDTFVSVENIFGSSQADVLTGTGGANTLNGSFDNDTLNGLGGNDVLLGGSGDDFLNGGPGDDTLSSGAGDDTHAYNFASFGNDTIIGFQDGFDKISLAGSGLSFASFTETAFGAGTKLTLTADPANSIVILGVAPGLIDAGDFV